MLKKKEFNTNYINTHNLLIGKKFKIGIFNKLEADTYYIKGIRNDCYIIGIVNGKITGFVINHNEILKSIVDVKNNINIGEYIIID
jgi:hypothetical protein